MDEDTQAVSDSGSASTVELEVSKSPPYRMCLCSAGSVPPEVPPPEPESKKSDTEPDDDTSPKPSKSPCKKTPKKKPKRKPKVKFQIPPQRTIRRDRVDQECRMLKIKYRHWTGTTEPKTQLHKSHCRFLDEDYFPNAQRIPGDCVLCPSQKYLKDNWDKRCHYRSTHQESLLVLDDVVMLQCKCSAIRSWGWDRDHSTRNVHYHCSICHWPRDKASQIRNHIRAIHGRSDSSLKHLKARERSKKT